MFFWFLGGALFVVWQVLHDPRFDVRLLMAAAILPDLVDAPFGKARVGHTLLASVALLAVVMIATKRGSTRRRHLLALPFGTFLHLVLDGGWGKTFWWPVGGLSFPDDPIPSFDRSPVLTAVMELAGLAVLVWAWRRGRLADPVRRRTFWREGTIAL